MSCKSFTLFAKLPLEIRGRIWELSVPFLDTCLVPCCYNSTCSPPDDPSMLAYYANNRHLFGRTLVIVSAMLVNHEAYHCLLAFLRRTRKSDDQPLTTTFQPAFDVELSGLRADVPYISTACEPFNMSTLERRNMNISAFAVSMRFFYVSEPDFELDLPHIAGARLFIILNGVHRTVNYMQPEDRWIYKPLTSHFIWNHSESTFDFIQGDIDERTAHEQAYAALQRVLCKQWRDIGARWEGPRETRPALAIRHHRYWANPFSKSSVQPPLKYAAETGYPYPGEFLRYR